MDLTFSAVIARAAADPDPREVRRQRLAKALRDNIARRKSQKKLREASSDERPRDEPKAATNDAENKAHRIKPILAPGHRKEANRL